MKDVMKEVKQKMSQGKDKLSEAEWNKLIDETVAHLNEDRGKIIIPLAPHEISENEYMMGINNRVVTEDLIRNFAYGIGDPNPLWRDPAYARGTRWGGIIAPPTFENCIAYCPAAGKGAQGQLRLPGFNLFAAGDKHEYFGVIRPSDEFRIIDKYLGVEEKAVKGKAYRLFIESGQRTYINQREEVVVIATGRSVMTGTAPGVDDSEAQLYKDMKRHHFTKEELDAVHRHYDDELEGKGRRGKEVRYWEYVVEGEELMPIIKGPIDMCDASAGMIVNYPYAYAIKWAVMRKELQHHPVDPETGEYRYRRDWHYEDALAQVMGAPYAFQEGTRNESMLAHLVTNWIGDDGFVKVFDCQNRRINILGNMNYLRGRVARKYIKDGEHLVDLRVWAENQDGLVNTNGTVTVRLISRSD